MKKMLLGAVLAMLGVAVVAGIVVASGLVSVAADEPHSDLVYDALTIARERSIAARAGDIAIPGNLDDVQRIRRGAADYDAKCAGCHLRPGESDTGLRRGLYPRPPSLVLDAEHDDHEHASIDERARLFWIIKHGIKASGMPAWSMSGMSDESIWDLVALLGELPHIPAERFHALVGTETGSMGSHMADNSDGGETGAAPALSPADARKDGDHMEESAPRMEGGGEPHRDDGHGH